MREIKLPVYGIMVTLAINEGKVSSGFIESETLHKNAEPIGYKAAVKALEVFILAAAIAGVDIENKAFVEAVEVTADKIANEYQE